jgi:hypothetical protein
MPAPRNSAQIIKLPSAAAAKRLEAVKRVRAAVEKKMTYLMDGLSINVADALFEEMQDLVEQDALRCHFNIMRALKTGSRRLREQFTTLTDISWVDLNHCRDVQSVPDAPADVTALLKGYSDRNLNHYKILLEELRLRFSNLAKRDISFHPLLPGNFYLCFWHATEELDVTFQERMLLMPLFNRFVMDRFGQVMGIANQTLVELEVPAILPED